MNPVSYEQRIANLVALERNGISPLVAINESDHEVGVYYFDFKVGNLQAVYSAAYDEAWFVDEYGIPIMADPKYDRYLELVVDWANGKPPVDLRDSLLASVARATHNIAESTV